MQLARALWARIDLRMRQVQEALEAERRGEPIDWEAIGDPGLDGQTLLEQMQASMAAGF
jgi:hypothetical protein